MPRPPPKKITRGSLRRLIDVMSFVRRLAEFVLACAVLNAPCFGNEICYLANGFQIEGISHTIDHDRLALKTATGSMEFPLAAVAKIEPVADAISATPPVGLSTQQVLQKAAEAEGLPEALVRSVARTESAYNPNAVSAKGAIGLMQLMPATASELGVKPTLPEENALGGAKYLRDLLVRYHGNAVLALAAYNAGPNAVSKYGGVPPYAETRQYVERVLREFLRHQEQTHPATKGRAAGNASKTPIATD